MNTTALGRPLPLLAGLAATALLLSAACSSSDTASSGSAGQSSTSTSTGGAGGQASTGGQASSGGQTSSGGGGGAPANPNCAVPPGASDMIKEGIPADSLVCTRYPFPLAAPRDVVEAADGTILVSEFGAGRIVALTNDGFVTVAQNLVSPIGLREDADGSLLVTEEGLFSLAHIDRATGARTEIAKMPHNVTYLALAGGAAYVSSFFELADTQKGGVYRVDLATATVTPFATALNVPEGLFLDPAGRLFVAEWLLPSAVYRFGPGGGAASASLKVGEGYQNVYGLATDGTGGFYAGDHAGKITHVAQDGTQAVVLTNIGRPGGLWIAKNGDMWIAEFVDFGQTGYLIRLRGL